MSVVIDGSTALVSGASSGIGRANAVALAAAGATVAVTARRAERLEKPDLGAVVATKHDDVDSFIATVSAL